MFQPNPFPLWERILQIQILKPVIAKGTIIELEEFTFHKGTLVLEPRVVRIDSTLGLHNDCLMDFSILSLDDQEIQSRSSRFNVLNLPWQNSFFSSSPLQAILR